MVKKMLALSVLVSAMLPAFAGCSSSVESASPVESVSASPTTSSVKIHSNDDLTEKQRQALEVFDKYAVAITSVSPDVSSRIAADVSLAVGESLSEEEYNSIENYDFIVDFIGSLPQEKQKAIADKVMGKLSSETLGVYFVEGMSSAEKVDFAMRVSAYEAAASAAAQGHVQKDFRVTEESVVTEEGDYLTFEGLASSVYSSDEKWKGDVPSGAIHPVTFVYVDGGWKIDAKDWSERQIQLLKDAGSNDVSGIVKAGQ